MVSVHVFPYISDQLVVISFVLSSRTATEFQRVWGCCCGGCCYNNRNDDALYSILHSEQKLEVLAYTIFNWEYSQLESRLHFPVPRDYIFPIICARKLCNFQQMSLKGTWVLFLSFFFFFLPLPCWLSSRWAIWSSCQHLTMGSGSKNRAHARK